MHKITLLDSKLFSSVFENTFVNGPECPYSLCTECFKKSIVTSEERATLFPISFFFCTFPATSNYLGDEEIPKQR